MVDNFNKFNNIQLGKNEFIFIQILQRSKDNPNIGANNRLIKYYCIDNIANLNNKKEDIIKLCESMNARAYIHYTPRNYNTIHIEMISELANRLKCSQSDRGLRNVFTTACGRSYVTNKKTWVVDIDEVDDKLVDDVKNFICNHCDPYNVEKIIDVIPTKNGYHLITIGFNSKVFNEKYPHISIHKNNPTILYIP